MTTDNLAVRYDVRLDPPRHEIEVTLVIEGRTDGEDLWVESPTWVPGDYEFVPFGRDVFEVKAINVETGGLLAVHRDGWQGYRVDNAGPTVQVTYRAYCASTQFGEACGILDDRNGVLLGTRYLRVPSHSGSCTVTYELPEGWTVHHPSGAVQCGKTTWEYPSYEVLLDTPVVFGAFESRTRTVQGTNFYYIFLDGGVGFELRVEEFVDKVTKIAEFYHGMFGSFPFGDYTYIFSLNPTAEWGLEHLTSTMIGLGPKVFTDLDQENIGIRTCAHELFHAWNVRRLRPVTLDHLDLRGGSFTEGMWVAEGFTRYYEFLSCTRTGVYAPEQFFSTIVNYYRHLVALPAYQRVSAVDSSLATFLNHDDKYPGRVNNALDYYDQGMVIAFSLDVALRTKGGSLDSTFSEFFHKYVKDSSGCAGYTLDDLQKFLNGVQDGLGDQVIREASEPGCLTVVFRLEEIGFKVKEETVKCLGLVMKQDIGPEIYGVLDTSTAGASGIAPEDIITAVEGQPYDLDVLKWARDNNVSHDHEPAAVTLDVLRGNQKHTYKIPIGQATAITELAWDSNDPQQVERIAAWLNSSFAPERGQKIPLDFYENFHGVETVI